MAFIVLITQYALFIKNAVHTAVGSKLPFKLSINEQMWKLLRRGRFGNPVVRLLHPKEPDVLSKFTVQLWT